MWYFFELHMNIDNPRGASWFWKFHNCFIKVFSIVFRSDILQGSSQQMPIFQPVSLLSEGYCAELENSHASEKQSCSSAPFGVSVSFKTCLLRCL